LDCFFFFVFSLFFFFFALFFFSLDEERSALIVQAAEKVVEENCRPFPSIDIFKRVRAQSTKHQRQEVIGESLRTQLAGKASGRVNWSSQHHVNMGQSATT